MKLSDFNITLDEDLLEIGKHRLEETFSVNSFSLLKLIPDISVSQAHEIKLIGGFAAAKLILCFMDRAKWNRFAVAESKRARAYLDREDNDDSFFLLFSKTIGISYIKKDSFYLIRLFDYLKYAPREREYILSYKQVSNGYVYVSFAEFKRIIESKVRFDIFTSIERLHIMSRQSLNDQNNVDKILLMAKEIADQLSSRYSPKIKFKEIGTATYPPCIVSLLEKASHSENISHNGRWFLTIYLLKIGMKKDNISSIFKQLPDYNEKITNYQIEYIAKKNYSVPSCSNVKSMQLCVNECKINNPLQYKSIRDNKTKTNDNNFSIGGVNN